MDVEHANNGWSETTTTALLVLADGTVLEGFGLGALGHAVGEVCFNTSMTGYQETMTDPSYAGQIITFTFPMIGNYGVSEEAMESDRIHGRGAIMRAAVNRGASGWLSWLTEHGIPAISDVDTRALVRHIRDQGAMRGGIFPADLAEEEAQERLRAEPEMTGRDL